MLRPYLELFQQSIYFYCFTQNPIEIDPNLECRLCVATAGVQPAS